VLTTTFGTADRRRWSTVDGVIRDVTELREHGQVYRRVAALQVDPDAWRAGMRRAARREGMRIRTFVLAPPPTASSGNSDHASHAGHADHADHVDHVVDGPGADLPTDQQDPVDGNGTEHLGPLVYAVRTDLPPDHDKLMATRNQPAAARVAPTIEAAPRPAASVTSLAEQRARRSGHPCTGSDPD
jgi:hypothetical protein